MLPRALHYVDVIARAGSVRKAAERLNIAASAVNRQLLELEEEMGVALFERRPRGMRATAAGELLLAHIRRQRSDAELLRQQLEELRGLRRGKVQLAVVEAAARGLLPEALVTFRAQYPRIAFRVSVGGTARLVAELLADGADLGLFYNVPPTPGLHTVAERLAPLHAVVAPTHPIAARDSVRLAECLAFPVALSSAAAGGRALIDAAIAGSSMQIEPALEADSFDLMARFAQASQGVFFQIAVGVAPEVRRGELVAVPLSDRMLVRGRLALVTRRGRTLPPAAARLAEHLAATLRAG